MIANTRLSVTLTWIAGSIAVTSASALPAVYFASTYRRERAVMETEAEINARIASQVVNANPTLWRFQGLKLEEFLNRRPRFGDAETRKVETLEGQVVAQSTDPLSEPIHCGSAAVMDSGVAVGTVEICRSLMPLILQGSGLAVIGLALGSLVFFVVRRLPMRALHQALSDLETRYLHEQALYDASQTLLTVSDR